MGWNRKVMNKRVDTRIKLIDQDVADIILMLKFVIEGTGGEHDENVRARKLMKRFLSFIENSPTRKSAISSLIKEDISRIRLDSLM